MVKIADRDYKVDDVALITGKNFSKACGHSKSIVFGFGWVFQNKIFLFIDKNESLFVTKKFCPRKNISLFIFF